MTTKKERLLAELHDLLLDGAVILRKKRARPARYIFTDEDKRVADFEAQEEVYEASSSDEEEDDYDDEYDEYE